MIRGRRSFVYSFLIVLFIMLFLAVYIPTDTLKDRERAYSVSRSIKALDNKINAVEDDMGRGAYIVGLRMLLTLEDRVLLTSDFIPDSDAILYEVFMNGTYNGTEMQMMNGTSFSTFLYDLKQSFRDDNILIDVGVDSVSLSQTDPWHINIHVDGRMNFTDLAGTASWSRNISIERGISIIELDDPVYSVSTDGFVRNQIFRTSLIPFVIRDNVTNLKMHMENGYYTESQKAPSYLKRLRGDFSADENGIESLVDKSRIISQGLPVVNTSNVDYLYFSGRAIIAKTRVQGMPDNFYVDYDDDHVKFYGVQNITRP